MPTVYNANRPESAAKFSRVLLNIAETVFKISIFTTVGLFGYLLWGLFSGQLTDATQLRSHAEIQHIMLLIPQLAMWLNISLIALLGSSIALYYEEETLGVILILAAAFLAYGVQFVMDQFFPANSGRMTYGDVSKLTMQEFQTAAILVFVPGLLLVVYALVARIIKGRRGEDLTQMTYGRGVKKEKRPKPLLGAAARCWELPFCRDSIRKECPIFHAKTKCWKERVGCMCEENIILLAMGGGAAPAADISREQGFVPIGDLITNTATMPRAQIPTKAGARGVRIPTNPHLTMAQKKERCRNCVIYNEHERQKYKLFAPIVTLAVPLLVWLEYPMVQSLFGSGLNFLDSTIGHFSFSGSGGAAHAELTQQLAGSQTAETILIVCATLVVMTWALRVLEYCTFKIKI